MSPRMMKINLSLLIEKIKMKYITGEMVNEDIFPLGYMEEYRATTKETIDEIIGRLG